MASAKSAKMHLQNPSAKMGLQKLHLQKLKKAICKNEQITSAKWRSAKMDFYTQEEMQKMIALTGEDEKFVKKDFYLYVALQFKEASRESWLEYMDESESYL